MKQDEKTQWLREFEPQNINEVQQQKLRHINNQFKETAKEIFDLVPASAHRTAALRLLLQAKQTCVQAVTHAPGEQPAQQAAQQTQKGAENGDKDPQQKDGQKSNKDQGAKA